jgi:hypothetical protein
VEQAAVKEDVSATAEQPLMVVPFAVNPTVPVGENPLTVAVNVTDWVTNDGFALEVRVVVEVTGEPVPFTGSVWVPALSVMVIVLLLVPAAVGAKVTETMQFAPGLRFWPVQPSVRIGKAVEFDTTEVIDTVLLSMLLLVTLKLRGAPTPPLSPPEAGEMFSSSTPYWMVE